MTLKGRRRCMQQGQNAQCIPKAFIPETLFVRRVCTTCWPLNHFKDSITTTPPTTQAVSDQKNHREWQVQGKRVSRRQPSKPFGRLIRLDWTFGDSVKKTTLSTPIRKINAEAMFCTWCEVSHTNKTDICVGFSSLRMSEVQT
jgi:hypothetical protein